MMHELLHHDSDGGNYICDVICPSHHWCACFRLIALVQRILDNHIAEYLELATQSSKGSFGVAAASISLRSFSTPGQRAKNL
mmetsp:Transcript_4330/g.7493  ORF Transcript_4330/g.7493 Transcript_4330/m.7493 type:complete len:82 (-) Transcript_4330:60-305(-)